MIFTMSFGFALNKADELNTLKILKGYDGDYQLEAQLTRAQALTFIVRLIGKESLVLDKAELLKSYNFKDVEADKWYAAYTGYGKAFNLVQGYPDGTFRGDEYLNEREFYAMVLNALKIDFEWNEVENIAYENNLIQEKDELNQTEYLRESVVDVLYTTLDNRKDMIADLVSSGVITQVEADGTLVSKTDELESAIKSINVKGKYSITATMNESIESADVSISNDIDVNDVTISGKYINIECDETNYSSNYELTISNIIDSEGFEVDSSVKTFNGYKEKEISSNYFLISKIEPISKNLIYVYFTHPITSSAEVEFNYDIYDDGELFVEGSFSTMETSLVGAADNAVGIWLKDDKFLADKEYELRIDGDLTSRYNAKLDSGDGDKMSFYAKTGENRDLSILSFKPYDNGTIRILFNKDVDESSATKGENYELDSKYGKIHPSTDGVFTGEGDKKFRQVDLKFLPVDVLDENDNKALTIENIKDSFEAAEIDKEEISFSSPIEIADDTVQITSVEALNKDLVNIYLDRGVTSIDDGQLNNSTITNASILDDEHIFDDNKPYMVQVFMNQSNYLNSGEQTFTILANAFTDSLGKKNEETIVTFDGSSEDIPTLAIREAYFIEKNKVLVRYNYPVDSTSGTIAGNYRLKYDDDGDAVYINASSVGQIDSTKFVISFSDVDDEIYKIEADNIKDHSTYTTTSDIQHGVDR